MRTRIGATAALAATCFVLAVAALAADRLVLRDGRRIEGQLVSVQGGTIEFREDRGFRGSRALQIPRDQVERIELEERVREELPRQGRFDQPGGRPSGLREREVWVGASAAWADSGVDVRDGQIVYFDTNDGDIQWRRGQHTKAGGDPKAPYNARRPIPSRPIGALIGKIGNASSDFFFVGDDLGPVRVRGAGRLYLGINDENLADNLGAFRVTIYY